MINLTKVIARAKAAQAAKDAGSRTTRAVRVSASPSACIYCNGPTGPRSLLIDGTDHAHKKCHAKACQD